ncbi:hypothetical protein JCM12296A_11840 [Desulfosarcina cetonica]
MPSESSNPETSLHWQDDSGIVHRLALTDKIFLGRTCRGIDPDKRIIIRNPTISRDHAVVSLTRGKVEITDLSKNGTWVNDVRMAPGSSQRLVNGDRISLGGVAIYLCHPQGTAAATDTWSEQTAIQPASVFVTSLVADVRGFTTFSQQADSAVVHAFITDLFARFTQIVSQHHGTLKDYVGDAVFAFWEHPLGGGAEYARSACQAAIDQMRSVPEIHRQLARRGLTMARPRIGWGLTSGLITLSHFGSRASDLALVGDCVNLAFRLSTMANKTIPTPILLCSQTAAMVSDQLRLVDMGCQPIRGRTGQEQLFGIQLD